MTEAKHLRELDDREPLAEKCPDCGKRRYRTRNAAKAAARRFSPGEAVSVYRCGEFFHFGHRPYSVRRGFESREAWTPRDWQTR